MGDNLPIVPLGSSFAVKDFLTAIYSTCALSTEGRVKCWGSSQSGRLGYENSDSIAQNAGEMGDSLGFVNLGSGFNASHFSKESSGGHHNCIISVEDTAKCWGWGGGTFE